MFVYLRSKSGVMGINLDNVVDFEYDDYAKKLSVRFVDGRSSTTMDERYIKAFLETIAILERKDKAHGITL